MSWFGVLQEAAAKTQLEVQAILGVKAWEIKEERRRIKQAKPSDCDAAPFQKRGGEKDGEAPRSSWVVPVWSCSAEIASQGLGAEITRPGAWAGSVIGCELPKEDRPSAGALWQILNTLPLKAATCTPGEVPAGRPEQLSLWLLWGVQFDPLICHQHRRARSALPSCFQACADEKILMTWTVPLLHTTTKRPAWNNCARGLCNLRENARLQTGIKWMNGDRAWEERETELKMELYYMYMYVYRYIWHVTFSLSLFFVHLSLSLSAYIGQFNGMQYSKRRFSRI